MVITTYSKLLLGKHSLLIMVKPAYYNTLKAKDVALYLTLVKYYSIFRKLKE